MKLLIISRWFPSVFFGGISEHTYHLSKVLSENKIDVHVLTFSSEKIVKEIKGYNNVKILPLIKKWGFLGIFKIKKEIERINPDSILLQYEPYMYNYYGIPIWLCFLAFILRIKNFKFNIIFHEVAIRFDIRKPKYFGIAILQRIIAYLLCIFSKRIITSIQHYKKMLNIFNLFSKKIFIIPVPPNILPIELDKNEIKEIKNKIAPNKEFIISTFGQDIRTYYLLLPVIKILSNEKLKIKFLFIGKLPSDWINNFKEKAKEMGILHLLHFTGYLNSEEVYKYLSVSDLYISLDYVDERGWGGTSIKRTSLSAAYAAGLPIIGTKGDMTDDFFKNLENIFLIKKLEVDEIVNAIKKIIIDKELYNRLKYFSKKTYEEKLNWKIIGEKYMSVIKYGRV